MMCKPVKGFTLVELIIVIIVLGVLAALAIPQLTDASKDAKEGQLAADLAVVRNAINRYYHEHDSVYPGAVRADGSGEATDVGDEAAAFVDQLTAYSAHDGETSFTLDRVRFPLGPYLATGIPANAMNALSSVKVVNRPSAIDRDDVDDSTGWVYNAHSGEIRANAAGYLKF